MNSMLSLLLSFLLVLSTAADIPYSTLQKDMEENNAKGLVALGKDKVILSVFGKEGVYNSTQATMVLEDYFNKKPKGTFTFVFKGKESSEGVLLVVGNYVVGKETYRCTFQFRAEKNTARWDNLSIEKQ
jgi:hypothetical protein